MKLLVATLFLSGVFSAPFNNQQSRSTSTKCDTGLSRFHLKKTLLYSYEGETISGIVGTSEARTGLKLKAKCEIVPVSPCVHKLKITEAEILESQGKNPQSLVYRMSSGSSDLRRELLARDLYFESNGGVITSIRPEVEEPTHILNMKRGILSAFQLKLVKNDDTVTEVDVAGECSAKYHVESRHPSGKVKTIVKTKNLSLCNDRSITNLGFPTTPYPTDKPFSLLDSKSSCMFLVSPHLRVGKVVCKETHIFRPFSSGYNKSSGAMTTVRQTLSLIGHSTTSQDTYIPSTEKQSLKYEHSRKEETMTKNDMEVRTILQQLVSEGGAKPDSARLFSKLIFAARRLNMGALKSIWYRYYDCLDNRRCTKQQSEKYQTYIVDALSQCGTLECAQYMVGMISEKKVGTQQSIAFLTGIALVGRPSEDMVGNILYFCQETPSRTAFLTLGTLMHKFCGQHDCNRLKTRSSIYQADSFLRGKLQYNCQATTPEETNSVTLALKAIGNAGRPFSAVDHILKCAIQPGSTAINIEALQALRRVSCSTQMTDGLLNIFKSLLTDTEVRIETYLALMRCPSDSVINDIASVLDNEKNNQVGSFVWSHMTNALESTEPVYGVPLRNIISKALGERKLRTYNRNYLRFSHAYEISYYNNKHAVGGSSQSQVIFHPNSYFPRSAKFNLTVDIFGASINLLETAARFEGFESLIEQMFGAEGYFPDERIMKMLMTKSNDVDNSHRGPRSTNEVEMDEIKRNLEKLNDKIKIERKNPSGGLSFKVFGHELQFISFEDIDWLQGEADSINVIDTLINLARGGQVTYTKSFMFLEADHEIPTAIGFPLKLAVNGSAVSTVNLKGKFDIRNMFWGKKKLDVRGIVSPSAVIDISGKMSVDAKYASSGIHVNTSLYTATEINGNATFKEGEGIKLSIEPPTKPIYIVNVTSNLATYLNKKTEKITAFPKRFERKTCANFTRLLGINLCGHISSPMAFRDYNAPYFPLSGESSFGLVYQTTNAKLARFELEGRTLMSKDDNRYDWLFNMHIPGLTFGRRIEANSTFQFLNEGKYLSVSCGIHNYKFGKFEATYNNVTNGFHTKFSTPELSYLKPITIESEVFNKTNPETNQKDIGISVNATYNNFTIQEVVTLFKHNDQYGFKSNLTYWPRKHITTEARISLVRKSAYLKFHDTYSKSKLFFLGKSGKITNKFYVKVGNEIINYELKLDGELNVKQKKFIMDVFTKPSRNLLKFEAYPRESTTEKGFYMSLLHVNSSSKFTGHLRASNTPTQKSLKFSGMALEQPFHVHVAHYLYNNERKVELVASGFGKSADASLGLATKSGSVSVEYIASLNKKTMTTKLDLFKDTSKMGFNLHASLLKQTVDVLGEYFQEDQKNGLRLKLMGGDKTVDTTASYFVNDDENGVDFTVTGMGRSANLIAAYYQKPTEAGLRLKGSVSDKSMEIAAGLFTHDNERGLRVKANVLEKEMETRLSILSGNRMKFVVTIMRKSLELETGLFDHDNIKGWRVDALYNGKKTSLISTYTALSREKTLCSEIVDAEKVYFKVCSQYIRTAEENAVHLNAEVLGRKGEMRTSLIHTDAEKGVQLKLKYNNVVMSDVFMGVVTSPNFDNGLRFRGSIKENNVDALLIYKNTQSKRSIDLQLHVQGRQVSFETLLVREEALKGIQMNVVHENKPFGSLFALLARNKGSNNFRVGMKTTDNNGVEYKLSMTTSRIEKTLASMITLTVNKKAYKYGGSISYTNRGTSGRTNHLITTRLHYARNKMLTSMFHMVNNEQHFNVLSKIELVPGQFLTNKLSYVKQSSTISAQYELLPGLGMTCEAAVVRRSDLLSIKSTITVLDYPLESSITLRKIDDQIVLNITTCSAFSVQLAGIKLAKDDYQLILKHQYKDNVFEDLKLTINSLRNLRKLNIKWDAKTAMEFLRSMNVASFMNMSEKATKMTMDMVNYMRGDVKDLLIKVLDKYKLRLDTIKKQLEALKMNDLMETEMVKKMKENFKVYRATLAETYREWEKTLREMFAEMSPHLFALWTDLRLWLERSLKRYRTLPICGTTLDEMAEKISKQARLYTELFMEKWEEQSELLFSKFNEIEAAMKKLQQISKKVKMNIKDFTCNYDMDCTMNKVKSYLKKLADRIPEARVELAKLKERLEKLRESFKEQYNTMEKQISTVISDKRLRERALKLLQPIIDFIKYVRLAVENQISPLQDRVQEMVNKLKKSDMMVYYRKIAFHSKGLLKGYNEAIIHMERTMATGKEDLMHRIQEIKHYLETIRTKTMEIYKKLTVKIQQVKKMSWVDVQNLVKNEMEVNYGKLTKEFEYLVEKVKTKINACQQRHAREFERVREMGMEVYNLSMDAINGRVTPKQFQDWFKKVVDEIRMKIETLDLKEKAEEMRTRMVNFYKETTQNLRGRVTLLYPKVIAELERLVEKIKTIVKTYVDRTKTKISELSVQRKVHFETIIQKVKELKTKIMKKISELIEQYKSLNMENLEKMMAEGRKMLKTYETMVKEAVYKYKNQLTTTASEQYKKTRQDILDLVTLYKDMPIENILRDLGKRSGLEVEKALGFVIGKSLSTYETIATIVKKMNKLYQDEMKVLSSKWKMVSNIVRDMNIKYRAMAERKYEEVSQYVNENFDIKDMQKMRDQVKSFLETRYHRMNLSYEKVKHMKFKEFSTKAREMLQEWWNEMMRCRETCKGKIDEWKTKINDFIQETKTESEKVASLVRKTNEDIWQDAVATFRPYKVLLKDVLRKNMKLSSYLMFDELLPKFPTMHQFVSDFKKATELKMKDFARKEMVAKVLKSINSYFDEVMQSLNKRAFITQVRTHQLWPALKQEFLDHEVVVALQELMFSMEKLQTALKDYFAKSMTKLHELKDQLSTKATGMKQQLLTQHEMVKKQLQEKREEFELKLRHAHKQLKQNGEKHMNDVRKMYNSILESFTTNFEYLGEMSLYDVQLRALKYFEKLLVPAKSIYNELSDYMGKQLQVLVGKRKVILQRVDELREQANVLAARTKTFCKHISSSTSKWTRRTWDATLSQAVKVEEFIAKILDVSKNLVNEYPSYKDLMKMTPNQVRKRIKEMPYRRQFESLKTAVLGRLRSSLQAGKKVMANIYTDDTLGEAKFHIEIGLQIMQSIIKDAGEQIRMIVSETVETFLFLTRFYGMETVYSRRPDFVEFTEYHLRMLVNTTRAYKVRFVRFFNEASDMLSKFSDKFPELVKYVKTEMKQMDTKSLEKLKKVVTDYFEKYSLKLMESMKNVNKEATRVYENMMTRLNEFKEMGERKYRVMLVRLEEKYVSITTFINTDLPTLLKNARGKIPLVLKMMKKDLTTLVDDISKNLQITMRNFRHHFTRYFGSYENDIQTMKDVLNEMKKTVKDVVHILNVNKNDNLPKIQQLIKNVVQAIQQTKIDLNNNDMMLPATDAVYKLAAGMKKALNKQYEDSIGLVNKMITDVRPKISQLYKENMDKAKTVFKLCWTDLNYTWQRIKQDVEMFSELKIASIREWTTPVRESFTKYWNEVEQMRKENMEKCVATAKIYYKKGKEVLEATREINIREAISNYTKIMSEKGDVFISNVKESAREMVKKLMTQIRNMRKQAMETNENIMRFVKNGKMRLGMEELMNKTIEITENFYKINPTRDVLDFGKRFYTESQKIFELTKENAEFAFYIVKHVFRYNDLWGIIHELISPFHWLPPSNSIAMIFGRPHVHTFDGQYYKFVGYKKPDCTYVLAKDVRDNSFTLLSQEMSLIIVTKSGRIKVHASGKVESTVMQDAEGKNVNVEYDELPVEMKNATVTREGNFVKIHHDIGLDIVCDLKHFYCTFKINRFYHGRLAGLLGTNNNEQYDRLMKPDKAFAKSEIEFANAWEVSGDRECQVQDLKELETPSCKKKASPRCKELFMNASSPLATYFKYLNPEPFYRACLFDTTDCKTDTPKTRNFCNATAAYAALLRENGVWATQIPECSSCGSQTLWNQKANKNVDVVLLIPETRGIDAHTINLPGLLRELDRDLSVKYKPRYAVVGFGGKSGVHQGPHVVTGGSKIFGEIDNAMKAIRHMTFTNEDADALDTIEYIARMPFNTGSTKIVIMLTDQNRNVISSKPIATAIKELNMQGITFNVIGPYFQKNLRNVLGLWKGQAYHKKERGQPKLQSLSLPSDNYIQLAESSQGGIFNLKAISNSGPWTSLLKKAMKTTLMKQIDNDQTYCRTCVCLVSLASQPEFMCTINRHRRCS